MFLINQYIGLIVDTMCVLKFHVGAYYLQPISTFNRCFSYFL